MMKMERRESEQGEIAIAQASKHGGDKELLRQVSHPKHVVVGNLVPVKSARAHKRSEPRNLPLPPI